MEAETARIDAELQRMNKALEKTAKKAELKELESMISIYSPMKSNFATREEVTRLIKEKLE